MSAESAPRVFVAINTQKTLHRLVSTAVATAAFASLLMSYAVAEPRQRVAVTLLIILLTDYLIRLVASCYASVVRVHSDGIEIFNLMGKRLGNFEFDTVAIGPAKEVAQGLQVTLFFGGFAVHMMLSSSDERVLRGLLARETFETRRVPYVLFAFAIPLVIIANAGLAGHVAGIARSSLPWESHLAILVADVAFLGALAWETVKSRGGFRALMRHIL